MLVTVLNTSIPCKIETLLCVDVRFVYIEETIQHAISDENILKMKVWDNFYRIYQRFLQINCILLFDSLRQSIIEYSWLGHF